jgi:cyclohexadienyl dehydratase
VTFPAAFPRRLRQACVIVAATMLAVGCGSPGESAPTPAPPPPSGLARIVKDGAINICSTGDYRPFTYRDPQGRWSGLDIAMADDLAKRLNVKTNFVPTTWSSLMSDVGAKCEVAMGGISITLGRAEKALFSAPYLRDGKAAIIRCADQAKYRTLTDIDRPGVRVVTPPGGSNSEFDRTHLHTAQVVPYPDNNTIFEQLTTNAADVMVTDTSEIRWETKQNPQLCGVSVDHPFTFEQKAYLIPGGDFATQQWINQWLNIAQHDGTYAALSQNYLGQVVGP